MSGAQRILDSGADHYTIFNWCCPDSRYYANPNANPNGVDSMTVAISANLANEENDDPAVDLSDVFATIEWGSGTVNAGCGVDCQHVDIDIADGGSIVIPVCKFIVQITYPGTGPNDPAHPPINVNVSLGRGTTGRSGPDSSARRTIKITDPLGGNILPGNGSGPLQVPHWSIGARLQNSEILVPTITFRQRASAVGTILSVAQIGKGEVEGVRRANGARFFDVINTNAFPSTNTAIIFDVAPS